ncbi:MAG: hypothetical protein HY298_20015 [Verrucomicrobia bacterium]|nr:hypothetical protein [Verrucomicrobiota bacterium]
MKPTVAQIRLTPIRNPRNSDGGLNPLESEIITLFVQMSRVLGQPRSFAEIYGLLFISAQPLALDDLIRRLGISKGSASMGLKFLRGVGMINMVYMRGDRRIHYEAVAELRTLVRRYLNDQILPHLDGGLKRLEHIRAMVKQLPPAERARVGGRINMLQSWEQKGRRFLPMVVSILEG